MVEVMEKLYLLSRDRWVKEAEKVGLTPKEIFEIETNLCAVSDTEEMEQLFWSIISRVVEKRKIKKLVELNGFVREFQTIANHRIFKNRKGGKITEISNSFSRAVKQLGFNDGITDTRQRVTFHTLRHTFASWLAIEGTPILTIKELLGHKTLAMTERYSHLIPDAKKEAISIIDKRMRKGKSITVLHSQNDG
mgnify:CR=1 FL=1